MKRFAVLLLVLILVGMMVVVAPASARPASAPATVLHGTWTSGVATYQNVDPWFGSSIDLTASGLVTIAMYPGRTTVAGTVVSVGDAGPFPFRMSPQAYFAWSPAVWDETAGTYTTTGQMRIVPYVNAGLAFTATLVAKPATGDLTMMVNTIGSYWGWETWVVYGELD
jgi:hypothetical protein